MPKKRLSVNKTREILRLHFEFGLSERKIATSCGVARSTVADYLSRAAEASLTWPLPEDLDEDALERLLFPTPQPRPNPKRPLPDCEYIRKELTRNGVTLQLLWEEYREEYADGYSRTQFYEHFRNWRGAIDPVMRVQHKAGDKLFVDYAGHTVPIVVDPKTGEERHAEVFVATLGASNLTYVEATWTQSLPDWIGAHVRALEYIGGVPRLLIPEYVSRHIFNAMWPSSICGRSIPNRGSSIQCADSSELSDT